MSILELTNFTFWILPSEIAELVFKSVSKEPFPIKNLPLSRVIFPEVCKLDIPVILPPVIVISSLF